MKKLSFLRIGIISMIIVLMAACEKMPEVTPIAKSEKGCWQIGNYQLATSGLIKNDTVRVVCNTDYTFSVVDKGDNNINASFNFGDGSAVQTGTAVSHKFSSPGIYAVCVNFKDASGTNVSMIGFLNATNTIDNPEVVTDDVVVNIYHSATIDTIGLSINNIGKRDQEGYYFVSGDFNNWTILKLDKTRVIKGQTFILWEVKNHAKGLEKFNFGKKLTNLTESWNYSPKSKYWHTNTYGGELWMYFKESGISNIP